MNIDPPPKKKSNISSGYSSKGSIKSLSSFRRGGDSFGRINTHPTDNSILDWR